MFAHDIIVDLTKQNRFLFRRATLVEFLISGDFPYHIYAKAPQIKGNYDAVLFSWTEKQINAVIDELISDEVLKERASDGKLIWINHEAHNAMLKQMQIEREIYQAWLDRQEAMRAAREGKGEPTPEGLALLALFDNPNGAIAN